MQVTSHCRVDAFEEFKHLLINLNAIEQEMFETRYGVVPQFVCDDCWTKDEGQLNSTKNRVRQLQEGALDYLLAHMENLDAHQVHWLQQELPTDANTVYLPKRPLVLIFEDTDNAARLHEWFSQRIHNKSSIASTAWVVYHAVVKSTYNQDDQLYENNLKDYLCSLPVESISCLVSEIPGVSTALYARLCNDPCDELIKLATTNYPQQLLDYINSLPEHKILACLEDNDELIDALLVRIAQAQELTCIVEGRIKEILLPKAVDKFLLLESHQVLVSFLEVFGNEFIDRLDDVQLLSKKCRVSTNFFLEHDEPYRPQSWIDINMIQYAILKVLHREQEVSMALLEKFWPLFNQPLIWHLDLYEFPIGVVQWISQNPHYSYVLYRIGSACHKFDESQQTLYACFVMRNLLLKEEVPAWLMKIFDGHCARMKPYLQQAYDFVVRSNKIEEEKKRATSLWLSQS